MTDDALKAAVREAWIEIPHGENLVNDLTSALARRGVVVAGDEYTRANQQSIDRFEAANTSASGESPAPKPARKVAIRLLEPKDIPALLHIVRANWSEQTAQTAHVEIGQAFSQAVWRPIFYVAELDGIVVGCACYHASWMAWGLYDIAWVNTHPSYQNEGVGRALVSRCINDIRAVGSLVMLTTKIPDYYAKNWGFTSCFEHGGDIYMRLPLSSGDDQ